MNFNPRSAKAEKQASLWAARIAGSGLDCEGRAALDLWLEEDPSHRPLLEQYRQLNAVLAQRLPELAAAGAVERTSARKAIPSAWAKRSLLAGALAAATATAVWFAGPWNGTQTFAAPAGQQRTLELADGTHLELNAGTRIVVRETGSMRGARLLDGEAFFIVAKDKSRPFVVETPAGSVRVTGTVFDVRSEDTAPLEVTVVEGSVEVKADAAEGSRPPVALGSDESLSLGDGGVSVAKLSAASVADTLAWRHGRVVFDGTPLRQALERFAHYSGRRITAAPGTENFRVAGAYRLNDPDGFVRQLEAIYPVRAVSAPDGSITLSLGGNPQN
jgi:transmembrane sensor